MAVGGKRIIELKEYQHESDAQLISRLLALPVFEKAMDILRENRVEESFVYAYRSSSLRLSEVSAPKLFQYLHQACAQFGLEAEPDIYLQREYDETIQIIGLSQPFLLLSSVYLDKLDDVTLYGAMASYVAGIRAQHAKLLFLVWVMQYVAQALPPVINIALKAVMNEWKRCRYYTYDRAFYMATGDADRAYRQMFIQTLPAEMLDRFQLGAPDDDYSAQMKRFFEDGSGNEIIRQGQSMINESCWLPARYSELQRFLTK